MFDEIIEFSQELWCLMISGALLDELPGGSFKTKFCIYTNFNYIVKICKIDKFCIYTKFIFNYIVNKIFKIWNIFLYICKVKFCIANFPKFQMFFERDISIILVMFMIFWRSWLFRLSYNSHTWSFLICFCKINIYIYIYMILLTL